MAWGGYSFGCFQYQSLVCISLLAKCVASIIQGTWRKMTTSMPLGWWMLLFFYGLSSGAVYIHFGWLTQICATMLTIIWLYQTRTRGVVWLRQCFSPGGFMFFLWSGYMGYYIPIWSTNTKVCWHKHDYHYTITFSLHP